MPVYEYRCACCQKKSSFFVKSIKDELTPVCSSCGSRDMNRLFSNFAYHKSLATIYEESGDPDKPGEKYYNDPRNIGRWTEKKFQELGMEMPSQIQDMIQAARDGEMPESVKDLQPGLTEV
ncbi:MAG: zinc ribbon domain-containing protein [Dehalococcoidia bacterium]|nr:zinc ribbon domain-containing protein [Dehalococcoidia bacterium]